MEEGNGEMKRTAKLILALLIALMLAAPTFALAEEAQVEMTVDEAVGEESLSGGEAALDAGEESATEAEASVGELVGELNTFLEDAGDIEEEAAEANVAESNAAITSATTTLSSGTYTVDADVTVANRMDVTGSVTLVLNADLTASGGIHVPSGKTLTIKGTGTLVATTTEPGAAGIGGNNNETAGTIKIEGGTVTATGSATSGGAGIGGGNFGAGGTITISSGTVTATGANGGAGIGGGPDGAGGTITVSGGTVEATGEAGGAGIGGGLRSAATRITISGDTSITATGADGGAGIGGGKSGAGGTIAISGGTSIEATGDDGGAGIGGGDGGEATTITISGGTITAATGEAGGAGIGGGKGGIGKSITISGGTSITATGDDGGAGIGGGNGGDATSITISGGTIENATGAGGGAGIGGGNGGKATAITINGGSVTANGTDGGAGIGSGSSKDGGTITIGGGAVVNAETNNRGAAIGGGYTGAGGTITISATSATVYPTITATSRGSSAAIGGGNKGNGGTITISGGAVTANGGNEGAGIGGGQEGAGGSITIKNTSTTVYPTVTARSGAYGSAGIGGGKQGAAGTIIISGGKVTATDGGYDVAIGSGTSATTGGTITISGGEVTATGMAIGAEKDTTTLTWTKIADVTGITAGSYGGTVKLERPFKDSANSSSFFFPGEASYADAAGKTLVPYEAYKVDVTTNNSDFLTVSTTLIKGNEYWERSGNTVVLALRPTEGYTLTSLKVKGSAVTPTAQSDGSLRYTFTMSNADVPVVALFKHKVSVKFKTEKKNNVDVLVPFTAVYDGSEHTPVGGDTVIIDPAPAADGIIKTDEVIYKYKAKGTADSTYSYFAPTEAGTYTLQVTVVESSSHAGAVATTDFTITPKPVHVTWDVDENSVPPIKTLTFNGQAQAPICKVVENDADYGLVAPDVNFNYAKDAVNPATAVKVIVSGAQTNAGTGYIATATGLSNSNYKLDDSKEYKDKLKQAYTIAPKEVTATLTASVSPATVAYDGKAKQPTVTVKDGATVVPASEYTVEYANNVNIGTATATVKDKTGGNYSFGSIQVSFTIAPASSIPTVQLSETSYIYDGTAKQPAVTVRIGGVIISASEYTVVYSDNINVGTATVTVKDAAGGNYTFTDVTATFTITAKPVTATVALSETRYTYDGTEKKPAVTVTVDGTTVSATEYDVVYSDNVNAGTGKVTVTSKAGNSRSFTASATFTIAAKEVAASAVQTAVTTDAAGKTVLTVTVEGKVVSTQVIDPTKAVDDGQVKITPADDGKGTITLTIAPGASASYSFPAVTQTVTYTVKPAVPVIGKVKGGKKKLTVNWTAMTGVDGYQIQYGLKKSKVKTVTVANAAAAKKIVKKLKARKKYWVRICAYKNDATRKPVCSDWSAWKSVKTK